MFFFKLSKAIEKTNKVFESDLQTPSSPLWLERLSLFDYRCWQAKEMGFQHCEISSLVAELMGSSPTVCQKSEDQTPYDWLYNHHTDRDEKKKWWRHISHHMKTERQLFSWPPFVAKSQWQCRMAKLSDFAGEIPYGVILRILEVKELKIFNCFHVVEPIPQDNIAVPKPIFLATIWELPPRQDAVGNFNFKTMGCESHFLLSHWCEE